MILLQEGNSYNIPIPTYYVESISELDSIPDTAPTGSIAIINATGAFQVTMKNSTGVWNEI